MTYRLAVVGLEHYHVTGWVETLGEFADQIEIVALYDTNAELGKRLAPSHHDPHLPAVLPPLCRDLPFTTDLEQLIDHYRPDLALVTVPNIDAPRVIERLARAGIHMLVDKPGARTAKEAAQAFKVAADAGVKVAIGLNRRYGLGWQEAKRIVSSGQLGRLITAEAIFVTSSVQVRDPNNLIFDREKSGGGILHWLGVHDLDQLLWLTGDQIIEVQAMAGNVAGQPVDVEDVMSMAIRFASGAIGTIHYAYALPRTTGEGYLALRGEYGSIKIVPNGTLTWIGPANRRNPVAQATLTYENRQVGGYGPMALATIDDWLRAIAENRQPLASGDAVTAALRIIDAAYQSAQSGQRVRLD